ncbi:MAG: hypothetical protein IPJ40_05155 [Saprospirales bacterium]|nr:hypothetical protein [Saprospirales bacterium]
MFSDILFLHVAECPNCLTKAIVLFILAILLGLILGWILWGRFLSRMKKAEEERDDYHTRFTELEKEHVSLKYAHDELTKEAGTFRSHIGNLEADKAVLQAQLARLKEQHMAEGEEATKSRGIFAGTTPSHDDDLKLIEGVGPKIEKLLKEAGIRTFQDVVNSSAEKIREILDASGPNFKLADPTTWGKQAGLAAEGKWDELKELQDKLDGGRA